MLYLSATTFIYKRETKTVSKGSAVYTLMTQSYMLHRWVSFYQVPSSSRADVAVCDEFLHPLYLALVLRHRFVIHAVLKKMFLAVMNLSTVLQLEGA